MRKRFLAMLLSVAMVLTMLPVAAFAADGDVPEKLTVTLAPIEGKTNEKNITITPVAANESTAKYFLTDDYPTAAPANDTGYTAITDSMATDGVDVSGNKYVCVAVWEKDSKVTHWGATTVGTAVSETKDDFTATLNAKGELAVAFKNSTTPDPTKVKYLVQGTAFATAPDVDDTTLGTDTSSLKDLADYKDAAVGNHIAATVYDSTQNKFTYWSTGVVEAGYVTLSIAKEVETADGNVEELVVGANDATDDDGNLKVDKTDEGISFNVKMAANYKPVVKTSEGTPVTSTFEAVDETTYTHTVTVAADALTDVTALTVGSDEEDVVVVTEFPSGATVTYDGETVAANDVLTPVNGAVELTVTLTDDKKPTVKSGENAVAGVTVVPTDTAKEWTVTIPAAADSGIQEIVIGSDTADTATGLSITAVESETEGKIDITITDNGTKVETFTGYVIMVGTVDDTLDAPVVGATVTTGVVDAAAQIDAKTSDNKDITKVLAVKTNTGKRALNASTSVDVTKLDPNKKVTLTWADGITVPDATDTEKTNKSKEINTTVAKTINVTTEDGTKPATEATGVTINGSGTSWTVTIAAGTTGSVALKLEDVTPATEKTVTLTWADGITVADATGTSKTYKITDEAVVVNVSLTDATTANAKQIQLGSDITETQATIEAVEADKGTYKVTILTTVEDGDTITLEIGNITPADKNVTLTWVSGITVTADGEELTGTTTAGVTSASITVPAAGVSYTVATTETTKEVAVKNDPVDGVTLNNGTLTIANSIKATTVELILNDKSSGGTDQTISAVAVTLETDGLKVGDPLPKAATTTTGAKLETVWKNSADEVVTTVKAEDTYTATITVAAETGYTLAQGVTYTLNGKTVAVDELTVTVEVKDDTTTSDDNIATGETEVGEDGTATGSIGEEAVNDAIDAVTNDENTNEVVLDFTKDSDGEELTATAAEVTIPGTAVTAVNEAEGKLELTVKTPVATVALTNDAVKDIAEEAAPEAGTTVSIVLTVEKPADDPAAGSAATVAQAFEIKFEKIVEKTGVAPVTTTVEVRKPVTLTLKTTVVPAAGSTTLIAYFVDGDTQTIVNANAPYDTATKSAKFTVEHLSTYMLKATLAEDETLKTEDGTPFVDNKLEVEAGKPVSLPVGVKATALTTNNVRYTADGKFELIDSSKDGSAKFTVGGVEYTYVVKAASTPTPTDDKVKQEAVAGAFKKLYVEGLTQGEVVVFVINSHSEFSKPLYLTSVANAAGVASVYVNDGTTIGVAYVYPINTTSVFAPSSMALNPNHTGRHPFNLSDAQK